MKSPAPRDSSYRRHARPLDPAPKRASSSQAAPKGSNNAPFARPYESVAPSRVRERAQRRQRGSPADLRRAALLNPQLAALRDPQQRRALLASVTAINWQQSLRGRWAPFLLALLVMGLIVLTIGLFSSHGSPPPTPLPVMAAVVPTAGPTPTIALNIQPWDGKGRFTMLLMGVDKRPSESLSSSRTDVMIILSYDPATHSAGMLSIPRDLFVPIPGETDLQRINSAFEIGELKAAGGGPTLAMQTVQYNFGIHVNSYVVFTFEAVTAVIDAVGGVDINVPQAIDDAQFPDMNYGYDPLHIPAGLVHMDGALALKYARTRHDDSDFERTHRQQAVMLAVRDKVVHLNMLPQLVQQAPGLWTQLQSTVFTDLTLDKVLSLAVSIRDVSPGSIHHATIEGQDVRVIQFQGDTVLTPDRTRLTALMTGVFGSDYNR